MYTKGISGFKISTSKINKIKLPTKENDRLVGLILMPDLEDDYALEGFFNFDIDSCQEPFEIVSDKLDISKINEYIIYVFDNGNCLIKTDEQLIVI
jgi:hypothetical protein